MASLDALSKLFAAVNEIGGAPILTLRLACDRDLARQVKQLKKDGLIDLFLYGSTSASYLAALVDTG